MQSRAWPLYLDTSGGMVSTSFRAVESAIHTVHAMSCVNCLVTLVWTRVSLDSEWHILEAPSVIKSPSACSVATRKSEATIHPGIYVLSREKSNASRRQISNKPRLCIIPHQLATPRTIQYLSRKHYILSGLSLLIEYPWLFDYL